MHIESKTITPQRMVISTRFQTSEKGSIVPARASQMGANTHMQMYDGATGM